MSVFAFLFIWYKLSGDIIEKNTYDFTCPIVKQTSDYMDSYIEGLEKVSLPLTLSPLINKFLDIGKFDYYDQFYVGAEIKNDIYPKLIDGRNDIFMFSITSRKGIYYTNGDEVNMETLLEAYNGKVSWNEDKSFGIQGIRFIK